MLSVYPKNENDRAVTVNDPVLNYFLPKAFSFLS